MPTSRECVALTPSVVRKSLLKYDSVSEYDFCSGQLSMLKKEASFTLRTYDGNGSTGFERSEDSNGF
jgi:hypothetical protein